MREIIVKKAGSSFIMLAGLLLIFTFITAMQQSKPEIRSYTYLALGDSYTIGEKVPASANFPAQAESLLKQDGFDLRTKIIAKTGWTTDELQKAISKAKPGNNYDFVTLLIGVNNQYRGRQVAAYIPEFESLLKQAIRFARNDTARVIVLSIPDWGVTPFAEGKDRSRIAIEINEYNAANKLLAAQYHVHYIDVTGGTRDAAKDSSLLASDGLHPSAKEYGRWAEKVASIMKKNL